METQDNILGFDFTNLLQPTAFFAQAEGPLYLWLDLKREELANSLDISVYCPTFFASPEWQFVYTSKPPLVLSRQDFIRQLEAYLHSDPQNLNEEAEQAREFAEPSLQDYAEMFAPILQKITAREIQKAVPSLRSFSSSPLTFRQRLEVLLKLLQYKTSSMAYGFWSEEQNGYGYMGHSPEVLFHLKKNTEAKTTLQTMALAGTQSNEAKDDLLKDEKNRREHDLVVQDIEEVLKKSGAEEIKKHGPYVIRLPKLQHLRTDIEATLKQNIDPVQLVKAMHPTPALGVAPRSYGIEWMRELKGQETRNKFGAPTLFVLSATESIALINIRNIQWDHRRVWFESGGGLVQGSQLETEFQELILKRHSIKSVLL